MSGLSLMCRKGCFNMELTEQEIREIAKNSKWGFLREDEEDAKKAGIDADTGLFRTSLYEYLKVIFPTTNDWIHDGIIPNSGRRLKPDYRSDSLKLIVEFDGYPHYKRPDIIKKDVENTEFYKKLDYKVVRIPYFIQLSKSAVKVLFDVDVNFELFDERIPSLGIKGENTPAYLCGAGVKRMTEEFRKFPNQYKVNVDFLESQNDDYLSGVELLKKLYEED